MTQEDRWSGLPVLLRGVSVSLGGAPILNAVDLSVEAGSIVGIGGDNGVGKSTLLRVIAGLVKPESGVVLVLGGEPSEPGVSEQVGCAIDTPAAYSWMSARGHLRTMQLMAGRDDRTQVAELLDRFGLGLAGRKRVFRFSQGMKKRLALAQAALGCPRLLLLDEPTNALDPRGRDEVWSWLVAERERGTAVVVVSHRDTDRDHCDRWVHLAEGVLHGG